MTTHTVMAGETLSKIAVHLGVPLGRLIDLNGIQDPNQISVGQILQVPDLTTDGMALASPEPPEAAPVTLAAAAEEPAINRSRFRLGAGQYFPASTPKDMVMLHFTTGQNADGTFREWASTPDQIATPYILDRDGTIYETFDPQFWAYHLGIKGEDSENHRHDKRSVGIEIVNVGPLKAAPGDPNQLNFWPANFGQKFCTRAETGLYVDRAYRGFTSYATFTEAQMAALKPLVHYLCRRFSIPAVLPPVAQRDQFDLAFFKNFKGIATHQMCRPDKFDIGPAFDWNRVL